MRTWRLALGPAAAGLVVLFLSAVMAAPVHGQRTPDCASGCVTYSVLVTGGGSVSQPVNSGPYTSSFTVTNTGNVTDTYTLSCASTGGTTCGTVTPGSVTLDPSPVQPIANTAPASPGSAGVTLQYTVGATSGSVTLTARGTGPGAPSSSATLTVTAVPPPGPPTAQLWNHNRDLDRSACLTIGAGERAGWQCGDLQIAHSLPGYETMGKERALTLVYNSGTAAPRPRIAALVTEGGSVGPPTTVFAELRVNGTLRDSATYAGWGGATPVTRQLVLSYDASGDASGAYDFLVIVTNRYGASSYADTLSGTLLVVNRSQSRFGAGWWLAGVERLYLAQPNNTILWADGDGSAGLYSPAGSNRWAAPLGGYRDTISYNPTSHEYTRALRHNISVVFDVNGRHLRTENRVAHKTLFTWGAGDSLVSIQVPPGGSATTYTAGYQSNVLTRLTDPAGRALTLTITGGKLVSIKDPDLRTTSFAYAAPQGARLVSGRTDRRGFLTRYSYLSGNFLQRLEVQMDSAGSTYATTVVTPWNTWGLATPGTAARPPGDSSKGYTLVEGPRPGVADDAKFWVDGSGAPYRVLNAVGAETTIIRDDPAHPSLVTHLYFPSELADRRVVSTKYDARGNVLEVRDSTLRVDGRPTAVTKYHYLSTTPDSPDLITDPAGLTTTFTYNSWGLLSQVKAPNGHVTAFDFVPATDPRWGLVQAVRELAVPTWDTATLTEPNKTLRTAFALNALGNVIGDTSAAGRVRRFTRDAQQRITHAYDAAGHHVEYGYDALNRPTDVIQHVEQDAGSGFASPLTTHSDYDANLLVAITDPRGVVRRWEYDAAGRQTAEADDWGHKEARFYNAAGQVDSVRPRVYQGTTGKVIAHTYDPAGRKLQTSWPARDSVPGETVRFTYDLMDRLSTATHSTGQVRRTYYGNGALASETQSILSTGESVTHAYVYDAAGRRVYYRIGVAGDTTRSDSVWYRYTTNGDLRWIGVRWRGSRRDSVEFTWDGMGRRDAVKYTNGALLKFAYDADGALQLFCSTHPVTIQQPDVFNLTVYHDQADSDGMVRRTRRVTAPGSPIAGCGSNATVPPGPVAFTYDGRHEMLTQDEAGTVTSYAYDGSGNLTRFAETTPNVPAYLHTMLGGHNQLERRTVELNGTNSSVDRYLYDANGSRQYECPGTTGCDSTVTLATPSSSRWREYFYDGLNRMSGRYEWRCTSTDCTRVGNPRMCRYDPVGRGNVPCEGAALAFDGQNVVRTTSDQASFGWTFVHGPGLDDPIMGQYTQPGGAKTHVYWITDGQGRQYAIGLPAGYDFAGDLAYVSQGGKFAGGTTGAMSFGAERSPSGSMTKLSFFRNRFYDQQTGRWTQEDPIGVAGGLNLYQFNGNNPVSNTDPFGLSPDDCCDELEGAAIGGGIGATIGGIVALGCAAGSGGVCTAGAPGIITTFGGIGASIGGLIGSIMEASGNSGKDAPGQTAAGKATDRHGNPLGPSGKPQIDNVDKSTRKQAKDAARDAGKGPPVHDRSPARGKPHYHPTDASGDKIPGSPHYTYPR